MPTARPDSDSGVHHSKEQGSRTMPNVGTGRNNYLNCSFSNVTDVPRPNPELPPVTVATLPLSPFTPHTSQAVLTVLN
jgi:hypothetical protein